MVFPVGEACSNSLIPVLGLDPRDVTGIQQRRVCGARTLFHAKDFAWLDSCDKRRNEGEDISRNVTDS
ncbi:hypothetical protein GFM29_08950 [Rhizobium leguminosarum bv. viciae]|nr:hypothetical protein [Rhizobium leguminosarum bv. viciae]